jgi:hypothetical protein
MTEPLRLLAQGAKKHNTHTNMHFLVCGGALGYFRPQLRSINVLQSNAQPVPFTSYTIRNGSNHDLTFCPIRTNFHTPQHMILWKQCSSTISPHKMFNKQKHLLRTCSFMPFAQLHGENEIIEDSQHVSDVDGKRILRTKYVAGLLAIQGSVVTVCTTTFQHSKILHSVTQCISVIFMALGTSSDNFNCAGVCLLCNTNCTFRYN